MNMYQKDDFDLYAFLKTGFFLGIGIGDTVEQTVARLGKPKTWYPASPQEEGYLCYDDFHCWCSGGITVGSLFREKNQNSCSALCKKGRNIVHHPQNAYSSIYQYVES